MLFDDRWAFGERLEDVELALDVAEQYAHTVGQLVLYSEGELDHKLHAEGSDRAALPEAYFDVSREHIRFGAR